MTAHSPHAERETMPCPDLNSHIVPAVRSAIWLMLTLHKRSNLCRAARTAPKIPNVRVTARLVPTRISAQRVEDCISGGMRNSEGARVDKKAAAHRITSPVQSRIQKPQKRHGSTPRALLARDIWKQSVSRF